MSQSSELVRGNLLSILNDNTFHSGETLGVTLGISSAEISNHIKVLTTLGLDILSVRGKGYCLSQRLMLLNTQKIREQLDSTHSADVEVLNVIGSTNQYLKDKSIDVENGHTCLAEAQTAGRGRHGRKWVSPYAASLYLSMHWSFSGGYSVLGGLSLAIGVAIVDALNQCGVQGIQLKWPNDIYAQGKKLAGVLIEVEGKIGCNCKAIIGVGLNVALPKNVQIIDQPWIDLAQLTDPLINRNFLAGTLINELARSLTLFERDGLKPFISKWRALDIYANKAVKLIIGTQSITGINQGIDENGAILLETEQGVKAYHGGEISVRPI
ncbi:bifunctional biotin--[acetyl-CoA-carboxylase] ligase/biotin operon repressor BirA [uncultured Paraglaciecola sp.]|jgi:BirA family biotin operon repressor/biotin-[acetyl-CoA-carboxylase] ligase|uniref:bifunctional biotin--[acetyl-CoA-carboxylase] ligase/biotin operon repressor BirA n=1 Tax=uncultured Paraglaciecola sp. TaxID=1765024 RepID=UPI0026315722|nr:bifunctional biotin--[acetyl-CoA-carboxylase] ligase/biotin operon repressor BirA [uncultured Paraglaciecola sp.]